MKSPLVSVIVPVHSGERFLASALESIFQQDYDPYEVIVVDDGSTDRSAEIVRSYRDIHYLHQSAQGVSVARNAGVSAARGEFIAFLDQDDIWTPNKLSVQMTHFLERPDVGYTIARLRLFLEPGTSTPSWLKEDLLLTDHIGFLPSTLVVRKATFAQVGDFSSTYKTASDSDWFFRAKDLGIPMSILPDILLHKRIHSQNQSSQAQYTSSELLRVVKASIDRQCRSQISGHNKGTR